jgi:hypothetical protein
VPVDAHLLIDKIRLSEGDVELTGCEEGGPLRSISIKMTGDARFNSRGLRRLQRVITSGVGTGGGGTMFPAASWLAMTARNLFRVSFMARVASACSLSLFSICWNLSLSMAGKSTTFDDCYGGRTGGSRL